MQVTVMDGRRYFWRLVVAIIRVAGMNAENTPNAYALL